MQYVHCSLCGADDFEYYAVRAVEGFPGGIKVRCKRCRLIYTNPRLSKEELEEFYASYYDKGEMKSIEMKEKVLQAKEGNLRTLIDADFYERNITRFKSSGRYLEIGAGLGFQAWIATRLGFDEVHCTDLDPDAAAFAREHFGLTRFHLGDMDAVELPDNHFDFISCWHCIEHVQDMRPFLEEVYRVLKPGGVFFFATPNLGSRIYRLYRLAKFMTLNVPRIFDGIEHTYGLSPITGRKLCEAEGFEILDVHAFGRSKRKCAPPDVGMTTLGQDLADVVLRRRGIGRLSNHFFKTKFSLHARKPKTDSECRVRDGLASGATAGVE